MVDGFPLLTSIILVPLIGAFVMMFLPKAGPSWPGWSDRRSRSSPAPWRSTS